MTPTDLPPGFVFDHKRGPLRWWKTTHDLTTSWRVAVDVWRIGIMVTIHRHAYHYSDRWVIQTSSHYDRKGLPREPH